MLINDLAPSLAALQQRFDALQAENADLQAQLAALAPNGVTTDASTGATQAIGTPDPGAPGVTPDDVAALAAAIDQIGAGIDVSVSTNPTPPVLDTGAQTPQ